MSDAVNQLLVSSILDFVLRSAVLYITEKSPWIAISVAPETLL